MPLRLASLCRRPVFWVGILFATVFVYAYWPTLQLFVQTWRTNPEYSHGFLVPLFAGLLLYRRRAMLATATFEVAGLGLALLVLACAVYLPGAFLGVDYLNGTALVLTLLAAAALFGGMPALRWAWLPVAFLMFMIPLPFRVANGLSLFVFQALAVGVAILISRPWPDRAAVVLSAVPIAIAANVVRITLTTRAYGWFGEKLGDLIFHDLSGWLMMPVAVGMLWLVLKLIDVVWVPVRQGEEGHHPLGPGFVLNPKAPGA